MDDATLKRLADLVKSMHDQGLSVDQIKDNLSQMGISNDDISIVISEAGLIPNTVDVHKEVSAIREAVETGKAVKPVMDKLSNAEEHFERLHTKVDLLNEKHGEISEKMDKLSYMETEIAEMRQVLLEMKAILSAIKQLQEELIEINRKVLAKESVK